MHKPVTGAFPSAALLSFFLPPLLSFGTLARPLAVPSSPFRADPKPDKIQWNLIDQAFNAINRAARSSLFQGTTSVLKSPNTV